MAYYRCALISCLFTAIVAFGYYKPVCDDDFLLLEAKAAIDLCIDGYDASDFTVIEGINWVKIPHPVSKTVERTLIDFGYEYKSWYTYRYYKARVYCEPMYVIRIATALAFSIS